MAIDILVAGDTQDTGAQAQYVVAAMEAYRAAAGGLNGKAWDDHINVGDVVYDGRYSEIINNYDATNRGTNGISYSLYNSIAHLAMGNHDAYNPDGGLSTATTGSNPLAYWGAGVDATASFINKSRCMIPKAVAKQKGFYFQCVTGGTTGTTEPNWNQTLGAITNDNGVQWKCIFPCGDMWHYVNDRLVGGAYTAFAGMDGVTKTRRADSPPLTAMQAIYPAGHGIPGVSSDSLNPNNEYYHYTLSGTDLQGTYSWEVFCLNTELEYALRAGDTYTAVGYGPNTDAAIAKTSLQYQWLQRELATLPTARPKIMFLHWPWYWVEGSRTTVTDVYKLCIDNGVRLIFAGHQHSYVRFKPINSSGVDQTITGGFLPSGVCVPFVIGNGGHLASAITFGGTQGARADTRPGSGVRTGTGTFTQSGSGAFYGASHFQLLRDTITTKHIVAANSGGTQLAFSLDNTSPGTLSVLDSATYTFTAEPVISSTKPIVTISSVSSIDNTDATVAGTVNPNGFATTYHIEYGTTTAYGTNTTESASIGSGTSAVNISVPLTTLTANATYHWRIAATNTNGTTYSSDAIFATTGGNPSTINAFTIVDVSSIDAGSATTIPVTVVAGLAGDLTLVRLTSRGTAPATFTSDPADGWTQLDSTPPSDGVITETIFYRIAQGTDGGQSNFTSSNSTGNGATVIRIRGADTTTPIVGFSTNHSNVTPTTSLVASSSDASLANSLVLETYSISNATLFTGFTQGVELTDTVSRDGVKLLSGTEFAAVAMVGYGSAAIGPVGDQTATTAGAGRWASHLLIISPVITVSNVGDLKYFGFGGGPNADPLASQTPQFIDDFCHAVRDICGAGALVRCDITATPKTDNSGALARDISGNLQTNFSSTDVIAYYCAQYSLEMYVNIHYSGTNQTNINGLPKIYPSGFMDDFIELCTTAMNRYGVGGTVGAGFNVSGVGTIASTFKPLSKIEIWNEPNSIGSCNDSMKPALGSESAHRNASTGVWAATAARSVTNPAGWAFPEYVYRINYDGAKAIKDWAASKGTTVHVNAGTFGSLSTNYLEALLDYQDELNTAGANKRPSFMQYCDGMSFHVYQHLDPVNTVGGRSTTGNLGDRILNTIDPTNNVIGGTAAYGTGGTRWVMNKYRDGQGKGIWITEGISAGSDYWNKYQPFGSPLIEGEDKAGLLNTTVAARYAVGSYNVAATPNKGIINWIARTNPSSPANQRSGDTSQQQVNSTFLSHAATLNNDGAKIECVIPHVLIRQQSLNNRTLATSTSDGGTSLWNTGRAMVELLSGARYSAAAIDGSGNFRSSSWTAAAGEYHDTIVSLQQPIITLTHMHVRRGSGNVLVLQNEAT